MAKLAQEARQRLDEREREERALLREPEPAQENLPLPAPSKKGKSQAKSNEAPQTEAKPQSAGESPLANLERMVQLGRQANELGQTLERGAEAAEKTSLTTKLVAGLLGLVAFAVLWKTVLGSIVQALVSLALLALILVLIYKVSFPGSGGSEDA